MLPTSWCGLNDVQLVLLLPTAVADSKIAEKEMEEN